MQVQNHDGNYLDGYAKETCGHCGSKRTAEGHDGCIGTLKEVMNACCGHGETKVAYVQFWDGIIGFFWMNFHQPNIFYNVQGYEKS